MASPKPTMIELDRPRLIAWSQRADYRLSSLPNPPKWTEIYGGPRCYAALLDFVWAMLADNPEDFKSPEALAEYIPVEKIGSVIKALVAAMKEHHELKKAAGSTR